MTDKVELIRKEIERLKAKQLAIFNKGESEESCDDALTHISAYNHLLSFIDSLSEEPVSEDLEEFALQYAGHHAPYDSCMQEVEDAVKAGAKWQKEQDQSTIELAEDHAMLAGMEKMREQMMKDAIKCEVTWIDGFMLDYTQEQQDDLLEKIGAKVGDKVKLIIIKED